MKRCLLPTPQRAHLRLSHAHHPRASAGCSTRGLQGAHLYDVGALHSKFPHLASHLPNFQNPWETTSYAPTTNGGAAAFAFEPTSVGSVLSFDGKPFILTSSRGKRVACGVLVEYSGLGLIGIAQLIAASTIVIFTGSIALNIIGTDASVTLRCMFGTLALMGVALLIAENRILPESMLAQYAALKDSALGSLGHDVAGGEL